MSIGRCEGPDGQPGYQATVDGQSSECFVYNPDDVMSQLRAQTQVMDAHQNMTGAADAAATGA